MSDCIQLLHYGLDAIVQRDVDRMPAEISQRAREQRYFTALQVYPDRQAALREEIGRNLQAAWRRRRVPQLAFLGAAMERIRRAMPS